MEIDRQREREIEKERKKERERESKIPNMAQLFSKSYTNMTTKDLFSCF